MVVGTVSELPPVSLFPKTAFDSTTVTCVELVAQIQTTKWNTSIENVWQFLKKKNMQFPCDPAILVLDIYTK